MLRGGILMSTGNSPEMLGEGILVGIILVGRLGVGFKRLEWGRSDSHLRAAWRAAELAQSTHRVV